MKQPARLCKNAHLIIVPLLMAIVFPSCTLFTVVRNSPQNEPFIFKTDIHVMGSHLSNEEKARLATGLQEQLDDSISARKVDKVLYAVLKNPTRLDTGLISKSMQFMHYYLHEEGYFNDSINFETTVKPNGDQLRGYITFRVWPGKLTTIDSLSYTLKNDSLQKYTEEGLNAAIIKKGDAFAQRPISSELDRLVSIYKEKGYFFFNRSLLYGLWDTIDVALLQPTLDPFQQAERVRLMRQRLLSPTANLDIRLRPVEDSNLLRRYYVGDVFVYPDAKEDITTGSRKEVRTKHVTVIQHHDKFRPTIFPSNIYLKYGDLYNQRRYLRTLNRLNNLGSWRLVDISFDPSRRQGQDTIDFIVKLTPAPKFSFSTNFESSFSSSNRRSFIANNFIGLGFNIGFQNRNLLRGANITTTNLRYGVELGSLRKGQIVQTQQLSLSNSVVMPRFIFPGLHRFKDNFSGYISSVYSLNAAKTERLLLFNLTTLNTNWGYDFSWRAKNYNSSNRTYNLSVKIPNIEYSYLQRKDSLDNLIRYNPSIRNMFSDGLVASVIGTFTMPWSDVRHKRTNLLKANVEFSGLLAGMVPSRFIDSQLYRFAKLDVEYAKLFKWAKTSLVLRGFAGVGYEFDFTKNPDKRLHLPFFKQYYSGGPNSMRAWQLRRLGPGSTAKYFTRPPDNPDVYPPSRQS